MSGTRTLWKSGALSIIARMELDDQQNPDNRCFDDDDSRADYLTRYRAGDFVFVGLIVQVILDGVVLAENSLWRIEHRTVSDGVEADGWEMVPAQYPMPRTTIMPSPLSGVVCDAIDAAREWLGKGTEGSDITALLDDAEQWADRTPNTNSERNSQMVNNYYVHAWAWEHSTQAAASVPREAE